MKHGHDFTSYDIYRCCLCSPRTGTHEPIEKDGGQRCRVCGLWLEFDLTQNRLIAKAEDNGA